MVVRSDSSSSAARAAAAAAAKAEAARKAAEAKAKAAEEKAKAEQARQKAEAAAAQQKQKPTADLQRGSRARFAAGDRAAQQRFSGFRGSPDALDRSAPASTKRTADTETAEAQQAARTANRDNAAADTAFGTHQEAQRALNAARDRNAPHSEIQPLEQRASEAETAFQEAERTAQASTDTAVREAEEALNAQRSANSAARGAGSSEPFPGANEIENVEQLAKATPEQQSAVLGERAAFTEHDVTRVQTRAAAEEARDAVGPLQDDAREAHDAVRTADGRVDDARQALSDAEQARDTASPEQRQALNQTVREARDNLSLVEGEAADARKTAHESTQAVLDAQHTANEAARNAGDPAPFAAAAEARTAADVASLSGAKQREILGTESAISASEAGEVATAVRTDQVNEAATRINGESDPQRAAELLTEELGGTNDARFRAELLESTRPAQEAIGSRLTSDDLSEGDAQALSDQLAQAGELAGPEHARTLSDGVATGMDGDGLRGEVKDALENTVRDGNGALFGVELAQSLQAQGKEDAAKDALEKTKHGIEAVQEEYSAASEDALAREGDLARVKEQWSQSGAFSPSELAAGEEAFRAEHSETFDRFNDASGTLASTLNGADAALRAYDDPNSNIRSIDNDEGEKTAEAAREVMNGAPELVYTEAGQQALGEAAIRQGEGERTWLQGANEYGRTLEGDEAASFQDGMASATMQAAVSGMDQLAADGRTAERSLAVQGASDAFGDVSPNTVAAEMKGALSDIGDEVQHIEANSEDLTPIEAGEQLASAVDGVISARFGAIEARNGGLSDDQIAARSRLSLVGTAAGVAGLGAATTNLITDPSLQAAAQVAREGLDLASSAGQARVQQLGAEFGLQEHQLERAMRPLRALAVGGAAIGLFTADSGLDRAQAAAELTVESAGLIGGLSSLGAGATGTRAAVGVGLRAVGKASLVVGLGFSAIDTYQAIQRGDVAGAALAGAPLAGAAIGAGIGAFAGGVGAVPGAAIGFAVGSVISIGGSIARGIFGESEEEKYEKRTDEFLEGALREAGLPESAAGRLRDVDGDFEGMARTLPALAEAAGTTPREVLNTIATLPDDQLEDFVKDALDIPHNADDIKEAREKAAEGEDVDVPAFAIDTGSDEFRDALAVLQGHLG